MAEAVEEKAVELTEAEQEAELTRQYLAGEFNEDGPVKKEEEVQEEETEEESAPEAEGPAILENKRLRQKNREINEEMEEMKRQLQQLSEKVTQVETPKEPESKLQKASLEELIEAESTLEQRLFEAYQSDDQDKISQLIAAKKAVKTEIIKRPSAQIGQQQEESLAKQQWDNLEAAIVEAIPEVKDTSSDLYKRAESFAKENAALMKKLGNAGGLIAMAQALTLSKQTSKEGKAAVKNVVEEMEKIAEATTSAPKSTGASSKTDPVNYQALSDDDFEALYAKMQRGETSVPKTG